MLGFLKRRLFLTLLGFLLLAIFIAYAGPYFAFADYRPLESVEARVILFAFFVALWAGGKLVRRLRAYRASDRLAAAIVHQARPEADRPSADAVQLRERFEEAIAALKQSRRGGHSLYDLPWYVIIGAPGSGKTTALLNSGLKFPLEQRVGRGALRGVGGTRNCDWWFADEAVFLDTAGRYTTQDSDAASDAAGWAEFLALLRKHRRRRPLNGVILTISAHDLMVLDERGREAHVEAARRRLQELNRDLQIQLPVYVMVTKCDLVAGFAEYFDDLTQEGRAQVWGVTFPYEQTLSGEAAQVFPAEFEQLMARLNGRVFARIEEDRDVRRRARIFGFPQQMAALRDALTQFTGEVFTASRLDKKILLRGVYLTSGTQEGTPIDRLIAAIGRRYGVAAEAVVPPTGRGKAYFVERLLKEVLIGESGLAGVNRRLELKKAALQLAAYAGMVFAAVVGVLWMTVSYNRNRAYLAEVEQQLAKLDAVPPVVAPAMPEVLLPRLDALRAVVDAADAYRDDVPWSMRWGLYQGRSVGNAARDAYVRELDGTLLPRVAARIEERLVEFAPEPEKLYEYLKAYVMLADPRLLRKDHLQFVANLEWHAADTARPDAARRLSEHFQSLLEYRDTLRPVGANATLLARARSTVQQASIPRMVYGRLKREFQEDRARAVRLDLAGGVSVEQVIRRKSGTPLTEPVPAFFSRAVFQEVATKHVPGIVKGFAADDWVLGEGSTAARDPARLASDVIDLYERDYITAWEAVLNDLELVPFANPTAAADALGVLSGPASPLRGLLGAIAENTQLVQHKAEPPPDAEGAGSKSLRDRLGQQAAEKLRGLFGELKGAAPTRVPGALVTAHFQPLHRLMAGEPGSAPIDRILMGLGQVQQQIRSMGGRLDSLSNPELREILRALQQESAGMPPFVQTLVSQVGRKAEVSVVSSAAGEIERRYLQDVQQECAQLLAGRYPFTPGSPNDLPLTDFARLFGHDGLFDKFFKETLDPLVDRSHSPWTWRSGVPDAPRQILEQFEQAQQIRDLFFRRGNNELGVRFYVAIAETDASAIRVLLEIDGNAYEFKKPVSNAVAVWPGPTSGTAAVTWHKRYGGQARVAVLSPWSWFRLIDQSEEVRESDTRATLTFRRDGHMARVILEAASVRNPFLNRDWQKFSCRF